MTALYIIAAIAALLFLLFFSSLSVVIRVDDDIKVKIRYFVFTFRLPAEKEKKEEKTPSKADEPAEKKPGAVKKMIKENGLVDTVTELASALRTTIQKALGIARHIRVQRFRFTVTAAAGDPAVTAIEYGALCAVVFPALSWLQSLMKFRQKRTEVSVKSDFTTAEPTVYFFAKCKLRLWFILTAAVSMIFKFMMLKMKNSTSKNLQPPKARRKGA